MTGKNWYVIQVNTGSEHKVRDMISLELGTKEIEYEDCFIPLVEYVRKTKGKYFKEVRTMFPGYVFIISNSINEVYKHLKNVPSFTKLLGDGNVFIPLYENEVDMLMSFGNENYNVEMSYGFIEDMKIYVTEGPLTGREGQIKHINRHKRTADVEMYFMGRKTQVRMSLEIISKR